MALKIPMEFFRMFKLTVLLLKDCNITSVTCTQLENEKKATKYSHSI